MERCCLFFCHWRLFIFYSFWGRYSNKNVSQWTVDRVTDRRPLSQAKNRTSYILDNFSTHLNTALIKNVRNQGVVDNMHNLR